MMTNNAAISPISGEFVDAARERAYRAGQAAAEVRQMRVVWLLALGFFFIYGLPEWALFGAAAEGALLFWRGLIVCSGLAAVALAGTAWGRRHRDGICCAALALMACSYGQLLAYRGGASGALLLLVVGAYLFSPGQFRLVCLNGALFSVCPMLAGPELPGPRAWLNFSYLLPANVLAAVVLARMNRLRREALLRDERLRREAAARRRAQRAVERLHRRARELLHNTLPAEIAEQLQRQPGRTVARDCAAATVLFADLVGFTRLSGALSARELVDLLNRLYRRFDGLAQAFGLDKIKTVGDAYMAAAGATGAASGRHERGQHERSARMALGQIKACAALAAETGRPLELRIGIHSGPLVAGVIGRQRLAFDCWGQTVNIASRLQSAAAPGEILASAAVRDGCAAKFQFGEARTLHLRGCGAVEAYRLTAQLSSRADAPQLPPCNRRPQW